MFAALIFRFGAGDIVVAGIGLADSSRAKDDVGICSRSSNTDREIGHDMILLELLIICFDTD